MWVKLNANTLTGIKKYFEKVSSQFDFEQMNFKCIRNDVLHKYLLSVTFIAFTMQILSVYRPGNIYSGDNLELLHRMNVTLLSNFGILSGSCIFLNVCTDIVIVLFFLRINFAIPEVSQILNDI